jgi:hypothetical protein
MVATRDLKSLVFTDVRVRVPSLVRKSLIRKLRMRLLYKWQRLKGVALPLSKHLQQWLQHLPHIGG